MINEGSANQTVSSARIPVFDNIKFFLIVLVIYAHLSNIHCEVPSSLYKIIYSFHMPLFVFVSGYFTKKNDEMSKFWKINYNFLLLFFIFSIIAACVNVGIYHKPPFKSVFVPHFALWYLLCMVYWRITVRFISNEFIQSRWFVLITFAISILPSLVYLNYFSIARFFCFFPYFLLGYLCNKYSFLLRLDNLSTTKKITVVACGILSCLVAVKIPSGIYWGHEPLTYPVVKIIAFKFIAWSVALINFATIYIIMPKTKGVKEGRYTLFYYLFHTVLLFPVFDIVAKHIPNNIYTTVAILICIVAILYLLRRVKILTKLINIGK